jgi:sugar phosphate isomerase/epimerase
MQTSAGICGVGSGRGELGQVAAPAAKLKAQARSRRADINTGQFSSRLQHAEATMISRRDFAKIAAGAPAWAAMAAGIDSTVNGVRLGTITYSFRDLPRTPGKDNVDAVIKALQFCGIGEIELFSPNIEPAGKPLPPEPPAAYGVPRTRTERSAEEIALQKQNREDLRKWRIETPADYYQAVRAKFDAAGIVIFAYTINYNDQFTDEEIDATFRQAKSLGTGIIATSTTLSVAKRIAPFADRHGLLVAVHGHSNLKDPNQLASPESFAKALAMSKQFRVNLDIGHFTAANFDAVQYIRENHENITHLHIKDRHKNDGTNEQFGEGDTPIKDVLTLLKKERYPLRAFVEYEYRGLRSSQEEVKRCMDYMRAALA